MNGQILALIVFVCLLLLLLSFVCSCIIADIYTTYYPKLNIVNIHANSRVVNDTQPHETRYKMYTFYSEKYKHVYDEMRKTIKEDRLIPYTIVIPQEEMDACFAKTKKTFYDYRWRGCDIKFRLLMECIKQNMGDYILFVDSDLIFVKPVARILDYYKINGYDLVLTESCVAKIDDDHCLTIGSNIGVIFLKCTQKVFDFCYAAQNEVNKNGWDEGVMKQLIETTHLKHTHFPASLVSTQYAYNPDSCIVKIIGSYLAINKNNVQKEILNDITQRAL